MMTETVCAESPVAAGGLFRPWGVGPLRRKQRQKQALSVIGSASRFGFDPRVAVGRVRLIVLLKPTSLLTSA